MADTPKTEVNPEVPAPAPLPAPVPEPVVPAEAVPFEIAVLPLHNTTLFPETIVPLAVGKPGSIAAVETSLATEEKLLACISVRADDTADKANEDSVRPSALYTVGTLVMIKRMERAGDGHCGTRR